MTAMLNDAFQHLKSKLELDDSFQELIETHHSAVRRCIENTGQVYNTKLIGSLQRQTRIQPRTEDPFDIDILVELGEFTGWVRDGITPSDALTTVTNLVRRTDRYGSMSPAPDAPTVSFSYRDGVKVELVPAYRDQIGVHSNGTPCPPPGRGYWIPSPGGQWIHADYDHDAQQVTSINKATSGWLVPTIKMLKAIRRVFVPSLKSFHLELLACYTIPAAIRDQYSANHPISFPELIQSFFARSRALLATPLRLPGSNSQPVSFDQAELPTVSHAFEVIHNHCSSISASPSLPKQLQEWRKLFTDLMAND